MIMFTANDYADYKTAITKFGKPTTHFYTADNTAGVITAQALCRDVIVVASNVPASEATFNTDFPDAVEFNASFTFRLT